MGETLKQPPLIEALCQFVFRDNHEMPWDGKFLTTSIRKSLKTSR